MSEPLQFEGHQPSDPVSLVVRRRIRPGQEAAYEALLAEANALLARLPGHRGTGVVRPPPGEQEYPLLARFDSLSAAADWELSPERADSLARLPPQRALQASVDNPPGLTCQVSPLAAAPPPLTRTT